MEPFLKPVFVFSPQGGQWFGMTRRLDSEEAVFRGTMDRCDTAVTALDGWSIREELARDRETYRLDDLDGLIQVTVTALQIALVDLWSSRGVRPSAVVGLSLGEVAAAYCAGALSLEEAMRISCTISALSRNVDREGRMAVVGAGCRHVEAALARENKGVEIAAELSPGLTVLTGPTNRLESLIQGFEGEGIMARWIRIGLAYHGTRLANARARFVDALDMLDPRIETVPIYASAVGGPCRGTELDGRYWWAMVSRRARFATAVDRLLEAGHRRFLELGPHPILLPSVEETCRRRALDAVLLPSMMRDRDPLEVAAATLAALGPDSRPADERTPANTRERRL